MKFQTYFNAPFEYMANVCDNTKELCVNCVGAVDDSINLRNYGDRRDYYMMYLIKGSMDIQIGDFKGIIRAGNLLIMKPGTIYNYSSKKGSGLNYLWLHFTGSNAQKLVEEAGIPLNCISDCGYLSDVVECWKRECNEFIVNDEHFSTMTNSIFMEILCLFSRMINKKNQRNRLEKSSFYIYNNYRERISVKFLAEMENLSESHFRAVFTEVYGESPVEYIISRRVNVAIYLLGNSDKKLSEISELVGYNDVYYFSRQFKRKTGFSPGKYRKYILNR